MPSLNILHFVLDKDAFEEMFSMYPSDDDKDDYDDDDGGLGQEIVQESIEEAIDLASDIIQNAVKYAKIKKMLAYIDDKINKDEDNIDHNFRKIYHNEYVRSFFGFKDIESINNFNAIDFSVYKMLFPNTTAYYFSYVCGAIYIIYIVLLLIGFICKRRDNCCDECIIKVTFYIVYWIIFLGFFIYSIVQYAKIANNKAFELAKSIKAEKFIENFLKEFTKPFEGNFILISIILLSISGFLVLIDIVIEPLLNLFGVKCNKY
jgi:hypothetical protein